jgi:serine/threonine protein kinase/tetratricopeptide (TPR) repeat protein
MALDDPLRDDFAATSRFAIIRRIGAGGMGVVYEAYDRERGGRVAIKTLRRLDPTALYRLKQEFRSFADVSHPNLVALYELISSGTGWFFTMELVEGESFRSYVRPPPPDDADDETVVVAPGEEDAEEAPTVVRGTPPSDSFDTFRERTASTVRLEEASLGPAIPEPANDVAVGPLPDFPRLRAALLQLAEAICALHDAGKVHRDLKPSNVLVTTEGRVVVLDFGLATDFVRAEQGASTTAGRIVGTIPYMAPEQCAKRPVSAQADWYAVGVMLFQALVGRLPFVGSPARILADKQRLDPPAPSQLISGVPPDLDALCIDLMRLRPEDRPSGPEVLARLGRTRVLSSTGALPAAVRVPRPPTLIGRRAHLAALHDAFETARRGEGVTLLVHGSSGVGKTALVEHFLDDLARRKVLLVLRGRSYERESVPYKAFDSLVDELSRALARLPASQVASMVPEDVWSLARVFPVLQRVRAVAVAPWPVRETADPQRLRARAFQALRELLANLARVQPLVLYVDDLQWGDSDSAHLLAEIMRPPEAPPLLFIGCYRTEDAEGSALLRVLLAPRPRLGPAGAVRRLAVGPLPEPDASELAMSLLGRADAIAYEQAAAIAREADGSPFLVKELARYAKRERARGTVPEWAGAFAPGGGARPSVTLQTVLLERITALPAPARQLLEAIAVAARPVALAVVVNASDLSERQHEAVAALRAARMIRTSTRDGREMAETYHDRIRKVVLGELEPPALRQRHLRLALALEASQAPDPEALGFHFRAAGENERAARYAMLAADRAAGALAFDRAVGLYRTALELAPAGAARALRLKLADALANAGRGAEAARAYMAASDGAAPSEALELQRRAAEQFLRTGHTDQGLSTLRTVLGESRVRFPKKPWQALILLVLRRLWLRFRGLGFRERDAGEIPDDVLARIDVCWSAAIGLGNVDRIRGLAYQALHLLLALRAGEPVRIGLGLAMHAVACALPGGQAADRAALVALRAREIGQRVRDPYVTAGGTLALAIVALCQFRWRESCRLFDEALLLIRDRSAAAAWELDTLYVYSMNAYLFLGDFQEVQRRAPQCLKEAQDRGDLYGETAIRIMAMPALWLAADQPEEARRESLDAIRQWSQAGFHIQHCYDLFTQAQVSLYEGDGPGALAQVRERWPALARSLLLRAQHPRIFSHWVRGKSAVAAAVHSIHPEALLRLAESDAHVLEREAGEYPQACALLVRAGVAHARGDDERALEALAAAEALFVTADMSGFAAAARRRRGMLLGGEQGRALVAAADTVMSKQGIRNPERMAATFAPGFARLRRELPNG